MALATILIEDNNFLPNYLKKVLTADRRPMVIVKGLTFELANENMTHFFISVPTFQMSNEVSFSILDLIFSTEPGSVSSIDPRFVLGDINKGHLVIFYEYVLKNKVSKQHKNSLKLIFKKAEYKKISHFIANVDWVRLFENRSVQEM